MRDERGSVSVVLAAGIVVVLVMALGLSDLAVVLTARSRARTAADAAALAAVQELAVPSGLDPSALADEYAAANRAMLVTCSCVPGTWEAVVEVEAPVGPLLLIPGSPLVRARARAVVELPAAPVSGG